MKKTIIIIALLAVAFFLAWKKGWFGKSKTVVVTETGEAGKDGMTVDAIIESTSMTAQEKEKCRGWVATIEKALKKGTWSIADVQKRAKTNGVDWNQQLVLEACWQMHTTQNLFGKEYYDQLSKEIKSL